MRTMNWNYSYGDRVRVVKEPNKYKGLVGAVGTVESTYGNSISVKLDNHTNPRGSTGFFYVSPFHLEPLTPEEEELDGTYWKDVTPGARAWLEKYCEADVEVTREIYETLAQKKSFINEIIHKEETPMLKNYRVAGIKFQDDWKTDKTYPYALYDEDIAIGDTVVVMTGHHGMAIAEVCSIGEMPKDAVTCGREIICKVDMTAYIDRKARAKQMAELKKEMDEKVKALQETALYELMAEKDPSLKAMLEQFKALDQ